MKTITTKFILNGQTVEVDSPEDATLLWTLRERLQLTGTKFGCGLAQCGACTVHFNGNPVRSCMLPMKSVNNAEILTIEGISEDGTHPLQEAWVEAQVPQCGYCQSGQIMQALALYNKEGKPSREEIIQHMNGVICRCGTYMRIIRAIEKATESK